MPVTNKRYGLVKYLHSLKALYIICSRRHWRCNLTSFPTVHFLFPLVWSSPFTQSLQYIFLFSCFCTACICSWLTSPVFLLRRATVFRWNVCCHSDNLNSQSGYNKLITYYVYLRNERLPGRFVIEMSQTLSHESNKRFKNNDDSKNICFAHNNCHRSKQFIF